MFEVNSILIKTFTEKNIPKQYVYTSGMSHACATQRHLSFIALPMTKKLDQLVRSVLSMCACYNTDTWKNILN